MPSQRQTDANRRNARLATGPRNPARTRHNALKHGIFTRSIVLSEGAGAESTAEFEQLRRAIMDETNPRGAIEQLLADRIAALAWRLHRVQKFEHAAVMSGVHDVIAPPGFLDEITAPLAAVARSLQSIIIDSEPGDPEPGDIDAELRVARAALAAIDSGSPLTEARRLASHVVQAARDLGLSAGAVDVVQREAGDGNDAKAKVITLVSQAACAAAGLSEAEFWSRVRSRIERSCERLQQQCLERDNRLASEIALAILPPEADLDKIQRYESHLARQFFQSLHELAWLQGSRRALALPEPDGARSRRASA
jgi:hypothetical protein